MDLIELAKQQAAEIARAGHNGWGNTMLELAVALEAAREQLDWAVKENDRLLAEGSELTTQAERLAEALRHLRNHTSVNSHQIELIDAALHPTAAQEGKNDGQG